MSGLGWWMVLVAGLAVAVLLPTHGLLAHLRRRARARAEEHGDNALKHLLHESQAGRAGSFASLKGTLRLGDRGLLQVMERLRARGLTAADGGSYRLTDDGQQRARHLVRAHRLLERYLADEARLPLTDVHRVADRLEHHLSEADAERLSASLGHPEHDPHGDPIPTAGDSTGDLGTPITVWPDARPARISHLEDEPAATYRALVALGLAPGQAVHVRTRTSDALDLDVEGRVVMLPLAHAGNVHVAAAREAPIDAGPHVTLASLGLGQDAEIVAIDAQCQGLTRRRLLDLGFTPGTRVRPLLETFAGDPRAYRVRGTTIALRGDQASVVLVRPGVAHHPDRQTDTGTRRQA